MRLPPDFSHFRGGGGEPSSGMEELSRNFRVLQFSHWSISIFTIFREGWWVLSQFKNQLDIQMLVSSIGLCVHCTHHTIFLNINVKLENSSYLSICPPSSRYLCRRPSSPPPPPPPQLGLSTRRHLSASFEFLLDWWLRDFVEEDHIKHSSWCHTASQY